MKKVFCFSVLVVVVCSLSAGFAQGLGPLRGAHEITLPPKITNTPPEPLPAGTYTVGTLGDFPTITWVFNRLSEDGVAGPVVLELIDELYTAPTDEFGFLLNGPIPGAGPDSRVTIRPATGRNVVIEGEGKIVLLFVNTSYVTVEGIALSGETTLTIHSLYNPVFIWNTCMDFVDDSDYNEVRNITFISDDVTRVGGGPALYTQHLSRTTADYNLFEHNFVKKAGFAFYLTAWEATVDAVGNVVRGNLVGSDTDGPISWGIQIEENNGAIIENNIVRNIQQQALNSVITPGINSYGGANCIIRNNVVSDVGSYDLWGSAGILLSGSAADGSGMNHKVYNNMIYNINSTSPQVASRVSGIGMWWQTDPKVYNNTVYLFGGGANYAGSSCLYASDHCFNIDIKNNLFINTRDEGIYCASAMHSYSYSNLMSDNNNLLYETSEYNCLVSIGDFHYHNLAEWRAMGRDMSSMSEIANFVAPDLHVNTGFVTMLDGHGVPLASVTTDIDGTPRDPFAPDIGADEFELSGATVWQLQTSNFPADVMLVDLSAVNDDVCWAVGQKFPNHSASYTGYLRTVDGGTNWVCDTIPDLSDSYLQQVWPIDANTAYITAYRLIGSLGSRGIYKTTDGGLTWSRQDAYNYSSSGPGYIYFFDPLNGVAIGDPNLETYTTTDGGEVWSRVTMPPTLVEEFTWLVGDAICASGNSIWFATTKRLFKSTDRGYTWDVVLDEPGYYNWRPVAAFQDEQTGIYALKETPTPTETGHIYRKTTDGGDTWTDITHPILEFLAPTSVQYIQGTGSTYIVAGGGPPGYRGTAMTTDAGETWMLIDSVGALAAHFASDLVGWGSQWEMNQIQKYVGPRILTSVREEQIAVLPNGYSLSQNYPNPFNPSTTIKYSVPARSRVTLTIYGILGNEVETLINEEKEAGTYSVSWSNARLASGVYFYRLTAGTFTQTRKMMLVR